MTSSPESNDVARYGLLIVGGNLSHQENYSRALAADPRVRLVGLTDESDVLPRRRELNQALADELEIPYIEPYEEALAREDVDLVCLCPEPERRARMTVAAARAGKHVYVDKPLCATVEGAREVVEAVEASGGRSQMFSLVRSSIGRRCREVVESGRLGTLVGLHAELLFAKGVAGTADLGQPRREQASDGRFTWVDSKRELFCVGLYPLVLFEWLTGSRVEAIEAATANFFFTEHQATGAEDFAALLVGWEGAWRPRSPSVAAVGRVIPATAFTRCTWSGPIPLPPSMRTARGWKSSAMHPAGASRGRPIPRIRWDSGQARRSPGE